MEQFLGKKVFLQLYVKVNENWRDNERQLKRFGYEQGIITTKSGCRGIAQIYPENHPIGDAAEQRRHCRRPIQQRLFLLGQPPLLMNREYQEAIRVLNILLRADPDAQRAISCGA